MVRHSCRIKPARNSNRPASVSQSGCGEVQIARMLWNRSRLRFGRRFRSIFSFEAMSRGEGRGLRGLLEEAQKNEHLNRTKLGVEFHLVNGLLALIPPLVTYYYLESVREEMEAKQFVANLEKRKQEEQQQSAGTVPEASPCECTREHLDAQLGELTARLENID